MLGLQVKTRSPIVLETVHKIYVMLDKAKTEPPIELNYKTTNSKHIRCALIWANFKTPQNFSKGRSWES